MLSIITAYLVQTGKCALPHIGVFDTDYKPAICDSINKQILPPTEEIIFSEQTIPLTQGLVKFVVAKKSISENEAATELHSFCKEWKEKIDKGEVLLFETVGKLSKSETGNVVFVKQDSLSYYNTVPANPVLRVAAEHAVLVGDTHTTSVAMNQYYEEKPVVKKASWRVWALVLFIVALLVLVYSFYNRRFSPSSVGNRIHFHSKIAVETHFELLK